MIVWHILRRLLAVIAIAGTTLTIHANLDVRQPAKGCGNVIEADDYHGAPMFWVNCAGAQSGAEPVCAMDFHLRPVVCLGGPFGEYGVKPEIVYYSAGREMISDGTRSWARRPGRPAGRVFLAVPFGRPGGPVTWPWRAPRVWPVGPHLGRYRQGPAA